MKKCRIIIFTLIILCLLSGCSNEKKGVPESVVLYDVTEVLGKAENDYQCKIEHNVDVSSHIDNAVIVLKYETEYTKQTGMAECQYQYDKSSDLWSLIEFGDWIWETELKEFFTETKPHMGTDIYETYNYALYIDEIDTKNLTIICSYVVNEGDDPVSKVDPVELELQYVPEWRSYLFEIEDVATFQLGDNGIISW